MKVQPEFNCSRFLSWPRNAKVNENFFPRKSRAGIQIVALTKCLDLKLKKLLMELFYKMH